VNIINKVVTKLTLHVKVKNKVVPKLNYHTKRTYWIMGVRLYVFLTEASGQLHYRPGGTASGNHWIGGSVIPIGGLDNTERRNNF
jgi:hypothetical protein